MARAGALGRQWGQMGPSDNCVTRELKWRDFGCSGGGAGRWGPGPQGMVLGLGWKAAREARVRGQGASGFTPVSRGPRGDAGEVSASQCNHL